jgi:hypothetical protein
MWIIQTLATIYQQDISIECQMAIVWYVPKFRWHS